MDITRLRLSRPKTRGLAHNAARALVFEERIFADDSMVGRKNSEAEEVSY